MKTNSNYLIILIALLSSIISFAQTTLECDFTDPENMRETMQYHWNTYNTISPVNSFTMTTGPHEQVNIVRPLGGKFDRKTKKILIDQDTYKWDGTKYYYDWEPLKKILNNVLEQTKVYQLVLDNPSWAFQRGLNLTDEDAVDTYGNPWAPNDPVAWNTYIKAMLNELINTYGREQVGRWRYCVGREIGTPGHWRSGEAAFFAHYKNTEQAINEVLPEAQVGTHLLWGSNKNSYGQNFIPWCKANGAKYDFLGISYYPKYTSTQSVDMDYVYKADIAPLIELPEWDKEATLEIHEYALIEAMVNHTAIRAPALNRNVFPLMLAKMIFEKNLGDVFVWSDAPVYTETLALLKGMEGHQYYWSLKQGQPQKAGNMIDAIFSRAEAENLYEITVYNYNANSEASFDEPLELIATLQVTAETEIKYRVGKYTKNDAKVMWSSWKKRKTKIATNQKNSVVTFKEEIPALSYLKYEIITE
jgi:hypothetical protein